AHRPGDEQQLAFLDLALEERLTGPRALERAAAAVVTEHRPEDPQPLARGDDSRAHHPADARHLVAHLHLAQRRDRGGVEIAVGRVVQQVADAPDTEAREGLRALGPHALQVLHGCPELEGHPLMSLRANRSGGSAPIPRRLHSDRAIRASPRAAATPTRPRTRRSPPRTTTTGPAAPRP